MAAVIKRNEVRRHTVLILEKLSKVSVKRTRNVQNFLKKGKTLAYLISNYLNAHQSFNYAVNVTLQFFVYGHAMSEIYFPIKGPRSMTQIINQLI